MPAIARLWDELGHAVTGDHVADQLQVHRSVESAGALVAEFDGVVIGFASYDSTCSFELAGRICQLTSLVVAEAHRRRGVGRSITEPARLLRGASHSGSLRPRPPIARTRRHGAYRGDRSIDAAVHDDVRLNRPLPYAVGPRRQGLAPSAP